MVDYRTFTVRPKRDFGLHGFLIDGVRIRRGYVVIKHGCNVMPGATWFLTIEDAKKAIDIWIDVGGDNPIPPKSCGMDFWERMRA